MHIKRLIIILFIDYNLLIFFSFFSVWFDWFHNFNCFLLLFIIFFIFFIFFFIFLFFFTLKLNLSYGLLEFWICFFPVFFLIFQVLPSIFLLFILNFSNFCVDLRIKVIAHQWYWSYELGDGLGFFFDSYIFNIDSFFLGDFRLVETDNRLIIPSNFFIRFILTSFDVIHSWSLPIFFLKIDVISGLLNVIEFFFDQIGIFYGQCSEICGTNHSFIPIVIELILVDSFKNWLIIF